MNREQLRDALADLVHHVWADWWQDMRGCGHLEFLDEDGSDYSITLGPFITDRWDRQAKTNPIDLPAGEERSDYEIVDRYLDLVDAYLKDIERDWADLIESLGFIPGLCDVCGKPGVRSVGPEGYCHKHVPVNP